MSIGRLVEDIYDMIENNEDLPPYEVGFAMIRIATKMLVQCAPTELVGVKTVLAGVEQGIKEVEEDPIKRIRNLGD